MSESAKSAVARFLDENLKRSVLRFSTMGSVDDGKSTLIGRLLLDSKNIYEDHLKKLRSEPSRDGSWQGETGTLELALLTDGLSAEREQNITIDVAYRYFSTPKRNFILADTPGHEEFTRNMVTGASTAQAALLLVDARKGLLAQTKRHAFIASLLGIPRILVCINKMDLVDYSEEIYEEIRRDFSHFARKLSLKSIRFVPISALHGDNVVERSEEMKWYSGESVMSYLENIYVQGDKNLIDFRFPVQYVVRPDQDFRGYAGRIVSGAVRTGDEVVLLPSMVKTTVEKIYLPGVEVQEVQSAQAPRSVTLTLADDVSVSRGDLIARVNNVPHVVREFEAMLVWMDHKPMDLTNHYLIQHTTRREKADIRKLHYQVDVNTLHRLAPTPLQMNAIGRATIACRAPLLLDSYDHNRDTGSFVLIDPSSHRTVAAGMVLDRMRREELQRQIRKLRELQGPEDSRNLHTETSEVQLSQREARSGAKAVTIWFTGLSGSGKSTLSKRLERQLFDEGVPVIRLDGDNIRRGLNADLGFSADDRTENIRRVAEVAKLFNSAGVVVICAFISPFREARQKAREIIGEDRFVELYLSTTLEVCKERDPHKLYERALAGEIEEFTGVSSPYEPPENPSISLSTADGTVEQCLEQIHAAVQQHLKWGSGSSS